MEMQCGASCSQTVNQAQMVGREVRWCPFQVCGAQNVDISDCDGVHRTPVVVTGGQDKMTAGSNVRYYPVKAGLSQLNAYLKGTTFRFIAFN